MYTYSSIFNICTQDPKLSDLGPVLDKQGRRMSKVHSTFVQPP